MVKLYSSESCSKCKIIKRMLDSAGIVFWESDNEEEMKKNNILNIPTLIDSDGRKYDFYNITEYIKEYKRVNG